MNKYNKRLGYNMRFVRKERQMSMADLAHIIDKTKPCISRIESGKGTTTHTLFDIANALEVHPAALLSESISSTTEIHYKYKGQQNDK